MQNLTERELLDIHKFVSEHFSIPVEVKDPGLVKAIIERPDTKLYGDHTPYKTVFQKAASIMEATIRWHPFFDGNKRTALTAAVRYLHKNNYSMIIPFSTVRYTVEIAKNPNNDEESTRQLIDEIAKWMENLSVPKGRSVWLKTLRYVILPNLGLLIWSICDLGTFSSKKLGNWMAFDIYPEYRSEARNISKFLMLTMLDSR